MQCYTVARAEKILPIGAIAQRNTDAVTLDPEQPRCLHSSAPRLYPCSFRCFNFHVLATLDLTCYSRSKFMLTPAVPFSNDELEVSILRMRPLITAPPPVNRSDDKTGSHADQNTSPFSRDARRGTWHECCCDHWHKFALPTVTTSDASIAAYTRSRLESLRSEYPYSPPMLASMLCDSRVVFCSGTCPPGHMYKRGWRWR